MSKWYSCIEGDCAWYGPYPKVRKVGEFGTEMICPCCDGPVDEDATWTAISALMEVCESALEEMWFCDSDHDAYRVNRCSVDAIREAVAKAREAVG